MSADSLDDKALQAAADWLVDAQVRGDKLLVNFGAGQIIEAYLSALPPTSPDDYLSNMLRQVREYLFENKPVQAMDWLRTIEKYLTEKGTI